MGDEFRSQFVTRIEPCLFVDAGDERELRSPATPAWFSSVSSRFMTRSRALMLGACAGILLVGVLSLSGCATAPAEPVAQAIQIESVRLTAAGHYVDLRYRVLDPVKANGSLGPGIKPTLIDEASGIEMAVPTTAKLGALRQTKADQRPDRSYFVLFVNSAGLAPGSTVTAQMGDMTFKGLTVQ